MGRSPCCVKEGLKKGPWTQEEDEKLIAFVKEHGHGNWRALPKKCGLLRCGKSCRLRWNNYLRPDIKRGMFTQSEEQKIFQLHALVGNKWAFIASQLPKRTDNEIKNYWNTVLKKRLQKERVNSLVSFGPLGTLASPLASSEATQRQDSKSMQRQDDRNNMKSSVSASKKLACNSSKASSVMSCTHLAQWESARLEAEARLAKESQSSKKTHALFSFTAAAAFSALSNHIHTNHQPLAAQLSTCLIPNTVPSSGSNPGCLIHSLHPCSTINPLLSSGASSLSLPCRCAPASTNSSSTATSTRPLLSSLASQESIASALTLGPNGRLSWQAKELTFAPPSPSTSHSSLISQMLCQIERDHNGEEEGTTELQALRRDGELKAEDVLRGGQVEISLMEEATSSIIVDLNSTNMESSSLESWHDFIFDVENSCSDVVSSTTIVSTTSPTGEQFAHGALAASCKTTTSEALCSSSLDLLEGLNFDSLMSCDQYTSNQQHTSLLTLKELLWDTPPSLSISSSSIVN